MEQVSPITIHILLWPSADSSRFYFEKKYHENQHNVAPEARLPMSMVGAICFPVSLFWFAWSSNRTHWIVPVISAVPFGMGMTWM